MYETGMYEIQIHRKKRPKYLIKQQLYSNLGWSSEVMTTTAHSCSVLNLNHPLWHETCKLSNNNDWISGMWSMIKVLLSVWPMTCIYIHIELCMMLFHFICQRKYCFILYSFTYSHICTHTCWIEFLDSIPELVHEHIWSCSFSIKLCPLWVLGGWTSHLALLNCPSGINSSLKLSFPCAVFLIIAAIVLQLFRMRSMSADMVHVDL